MTTSHPYEGDPQGSHLSDEDKRILAEYEFDFNTPDHSSDEDALDELDFDTTRLTGLEWLSACMSQEAMSLEDSGAVPDSTITEAYDIPFGNDGAGLLSGELFKTKDGIHGYLEIASDDGTTALPRIKRDPILKSWSGPDREITVEGEHGKIKKKVHSMYDDHAALHEIGRRWPWGDLYDDTLIKEAAADSEADYADAIYEAFAKQLSAAADMSRTVQTYTTDVKAGLGTTLEIERQKFSFGEAILQIRLKCVTSYGSNRRSISIAIIDETGNIETESQMLDTRTGVRTPQAVLDQDKFISSYLLGNLAKLIELKTPKSETLPD